MHRIRLALTIPTLIAAASCGGDGGGTSSSMSDEAFCEYVQSFENLDPEIAGDDILGAMDGMIERAPNDELRGALEDLRPILEKMSDIDANDEAAFGEVMSLMFDPKVIAAGEVLEKYSVDVCGFEESGSDSSMDSGGDWTTDPDMSMPTNAYENLESGQISDAVAAVLASQAPDAYVASSGWSSSGSGISVDVDITGADDVDGVPVCQAVVDLLTELSADGSFTISITLDGQSIAGADSEGDPAECTPIDG